MPLKEILPLSGESELDPLFRAMFDARAENVAERSTAFAGSIPLEELRFAYRAMRKAQDRQPPKDVLTEGLIVDGGAGQLRARLYVPADLPTPSGLLIYFHGGGFVVGDLETHDGLCRRLARGGRCRVISMEYRLAPEHSFPAGHDDALATVRWCFENAEKLNVDAGRIAVGGDSAGANLAAYTANALVRDPDYPVAWQMLLYPVTWPASPTTSREEFDGPVLTKAELAWFESCLAFRGKSGCERAELWRAKLDGVAPALLVTAGHDPLRDEGQDYAERLAAEGVEVKYLHFAELPHDFYIMPDISPAVSRAISLTSTELRAQLA